MANLALVFDILAKDRASKEFRNVGDAVEDTGKRSGVAFTAMAAGAAALGAAAIKVGTDSVKAFVESEQSSLRLDQALKNFPATNDVARSAFDKLNESLAKKTQFDDDATASGQAVLAQFKLTGTQIQELTPLLQDYAAKTGKDLPAAALDLGKAIQGQGRALKAVGLELTDTGTATGNLDALTAGLRKQVGGFAEAEGKTAAGTAKILENRFGEVQEKIGSKLVPVLTDLANKLITTIDFTERHQRVIVPLTAAVGALTVGVLAVNAATAASIAVTTAATAVRGLFTSGTVASTVATGAHAVASGVATVATGAWTVATTALNVALRANPIGLVVTAVAALAAGVVIAYKNSDTFRGIVDKLWASIKTATDKLGDFVGAMKDFKIPKWVRELGDLFGGIGGGISKAFGAVSKGFGDGPGLGGADGDQPRGVKAMMAALPSGTRLISGLRPGAITATGNPSYHGLGRAVDIPPNPALFEYIRSRFGAASKELIFTPAGGRQIHNGRPHVFKDPRTKRDHLDHIHWAMANGGVINEPVIGMGLQSGKSYAFGERGPETVTPGIKNDAALVRELQGLRADTREHIRYTRDLSERLEALDRRTRVGG